MTGGADHAPRVRGVMCPLPAAPVGRATLLPQYQGELRLNARRSDLSSGSARVRLVNLSSLPIVGNRPVYPVGLASLSSALEGEGHRVEIVDFVAEPAWVNDLGWMDEPCDIVGFAIRDIDPIDVARFSFVPAYADFSGRVQACAASAGYLPIYVGGGTGFTLFSRELRTLLNVDVVVTGEGEQALVELCSRIARPVGTEMVARADHAFAGRVVRHPSALVEAYLAAGHTEIGVETRRRICVKKCQYCPYAFLSGQSLGDFKRRTALAATIVQLYGLGVRHLFFTDAVFNTELEAAKDVCRLLRELDLPGLRWSAYFVPSGFDPELAELAGATGNLRIIFSPDSFDPRMMRDSGKLFTLSHVARAKKICADAGLAAAWMLLFGSAMEDHETILRSAAYANAYFEAEEVDIHFGLRLLPGSPLVRRLGLASDRLLDPVFYPFDERVFDRALSAFDDRFFAGGRMLRLRSVRQAFRTMTRTPFRNIVDPHLDFLLIKERRIGISRRSSAESVSRPPEGRHGSEAAVKR